MTHDALTRVEAMLVALRDQVDRLTERVEGQLERHERLLVRLQGDVGEATWTLREELLEVRGLAGCARCGAVAHGASRAGPNPVGTAAPPPAAS